VACSEENAGTAHNPKVTGSNPVPTIRKINVLEEAVIDRLFSFRRFDSILTPVDRKNWNSQIFSMIDTRQVGLS
jgi:hypothetical protein